MDLAYFDGRVNDGTIDAGGFGTSIDALSQYFHDVGIILQPSARIQLRVKADFKAGSFSVFLLLSGLASSGLKSVVDLAKSGLELADKTIHLTLITPKDVREARLRVATREVELRTARIREERERVDLEGSETRLQIARENLERLRSGGFEPDQRVDGVFATYLNSAEARTQLLRLAKPLRMGEATVLQLSDRSGEVALSDVSGPATPEKSEAIEFEKTLRAETINIAGKPTGWKFWMDGKLVSMRVLDEDFLARVKIGEIRPSSGSAVIAKIRRTQRTGKGDKVRESLAVLHVYDVK